MKCSAHSTYRNRLSILRKIISVLPVLTPNQPNGIQTPVQEHNFIVKSAPAHRIVATELSIVLTSIHLLDPLSTEALAGIVGEEEEVEVAGEEEAEAAEVLQTVGEVVVVAEVLLQEELQMPTVELVEADGLIA